MAVCPGGGPPAAEQDFADFADYIAYMMDEDTPMDDKMAAAVAALPDSAEYPDQSFFVWEPASPVAPPTPPAARGYPPGESATGPPQGRGTDGYRGQQRAPGQGASDKTIGSRFYVPSSASPVAPPTPPAARGSPPGESATGPSPRSVRTLPPTTTPKPHLGAALSPTGVALFLTSPGIAEGEGK